MSNDKKRLAVIAVLAVLLAGLVIADRMGGPAAGAASSPAESYREQAQTTAQMRAVVQQQPEWAALGDRAAGRMERAVESMIVARSAELATARLRDRVEQEMRDRGLRLDSTDSPDIRAPLEGAPVREIGLSIRFTADNPDVVHTLIDRLENLDEPRMTVRRLTIVGPGASPRRGVDVTLDVEALAFVQQEGRS